jgi:hypothetical protein
MLREMVWCSSRTMLKLILMTDANVPGKLDYHLYHCGPNNENPNWGLVVSTCMALLITRGLTLLSMSRTHSVI